MRLAGRILVYSLALLCLSACTDAKGTDSSRLPEAHFTASVGTLVGSDRKSGSNTSLQTITLKANPGYHLVTDRPEVRRSLKSPVEWTLLRADTGGSALYVEGTPTFSTDNQFFGPKLVVNAPPELQPGRLLCSRTRLVADKGGAGKRECVVLD